MALLALLVSRCAAPPLERYLRLDATAVALHPPSRPVLAGNVQLLPFRARGLLGEQHVVYLDGAHGETSPAAGLVWEDGPALAVARVATRVLQAAGVAPAVLPPDARGLAAFWVDGSVDRFELVRATGATERAVVQLEFTVLAGPQRRPALIARYCQAAASGADPAHAFSQAVSLIAARLAADLDVQAATLNAASGDGAVPAVLIGERLGTGCDGDV